MPQRTITRCRNRRHMGTATPRRAQLINAHCSAAFTAPASREPCKQPQPEGGADPIALSLPHLGPPTAARKPAAQMQAPVYIVPVVAFALQTLDTPSNPARENCKRERAEPASTEWRSPAARSPARCQPFPELHQGRVERGNAREGGEGQANAQPTGYWHRRTALAVSLTRCTGAAAVPGQSPPASAGTQWRAARRGSLPSAACHSCKLHRPNACAGPQPLRRRPRAAPPCCRSLAARRTSVPWATPSTMPGRGNGMAGAPDRSVAHTGRPSRPTACGEAPARPPCACSAPPLSRRYKICKRHSLEDCLDIGGRKQRFCQQ